MSDGAGTDVLDPAPVQEPADRRPSWSTYQIAVLALTVLVLVWRAWLVSRWTWDFDDWVYMADTRSMSFGAYLMQDYNGHLMPAEFLLSWLVTYLAPLNFVVPVVLVSTACAASTWLWGRAFAAPPSRIEKPPGCARPG